MGTFGGYLEP